MGRDGTMRIVEGTRAPTVAGREQDQVSPVGDAAPASVNAQTPATGIKLACGWLVGEVENARAEGLQVNKLQGLLIVPFLKETLPAPHDDGMDHEPELVEKAVLQQRADQGRAAGDRDVLTGLLL